MFLIVPFLIIIVNLGGSLGQDDSINELQNTTEIQLEYVLLDETNPCARTCIKGAPSMVCRYYFEVEWYHTLSKACYNCPFNTSDCFLPDCIPGDGFKRPVVAVNRKIPGPAVEVCQGDVIIADVKNRLVSEGTTLHWHGLHQQSSPYMDGVPYVTQCPILPHNTFRYTFRAEQAGTHFWHSHIGMQRADGAFGALIVRVPEEIDPHFQFYDYDLSEHVLIILDWEKETSLEKFLAHHHNDADNKPTNLLINGLGRFKEFNTDSNETFYTPTARFSVEQGYRYRFRVINAGFLNCPIEVSVDNHTLIVISTDGSDIVPVKATSLVTYAGERFDFILNADQEKGLYWIRFRGLMDCDERFTRANQVAVLEYKGLKATMDDYPNDIPDYDTAHREGIQINSLNRGIESNTSFISMPELESLEKWDSSLKSKPDVQHYIAYDFYKLDNSHFHKSPYYGFYNVSDPNQRVLTPQFNHISMKMPPFPLLSQRNQITDGMFCDQDTMRNENCKESYCECYHGLKIPLNSVVELILVDEGFAYDANHPLHLHGFAFRVVAMERLGQNVTVEEVKRRDMKGLIKRNLLDPPVKDTVTVPDGGYTIVRFLAANPGYWIFHCHIEFHSEVGMALIFKVGEDSDMLPVPKNFPTCGDYLPEPESDPSCDNNECNKSKCPQDNGVWTKFERLFEEDCTGSASTSSAFAYGTVFSILLIVFVR